jgi:hypothetical protein
MKRLVQFFLAGWLSFAAFAAIAAAAAVVDGVQMPAWVERDIPGLVQKTPLAPGMELRAGDTIRTGAGARVYVKLAEGSLIQLGENASLQLQDLVPNRGGVFKTTINVLEGAFRFTTDALFKRRKREVSVVARTVTAGIRGTDLWGRSTADNQIVCLIEGAIEVGAQGEAAVTMDKPLQFYQREKGKTLPVGFVSKTQIDEWAKETAIAGGRGALRRGGRVSLTLAEADTQAAALKVYDEVRDAGYAAEIRPRVDSGKTIYRVRIANLPSQAEAQTLAAQLKGKYGITELK